MNWRNVLRLISADVKSYRLVRGERFRRFRENKLVNYALYIGACIFGVVIGWFIGDLYTGLADPQVRLVLFQGVVNLFLSLPTLALLYGLVFTQMAQIQRMGVKVSIQPLYWFPITWEEHTLASILANLLGGPLIITTFIASAVLVASLFLGMVPLAVFTTLALLVSLFLASTTTEILKTLRVRISGAVTKVAGKAGIWIRLLGSIVFFIVTYLIYFSLYYNVSLLTLLEVVAGGQKAVWFIPYVWPGMALTYLVGGLELETIVFSLTSITFLFILFFAAVGVNSRFGLYQAPAIRVSSGVYTPRASLLGRLGFSSSESAMMKKDFRAFTRRRELMYIFILPIVFTIMPLLSFMRGGAPIVQSLLFAYLTLVPGGLILMMLGSSMIGLEGESVWYIYTSPITARSLLKAKYSFAVLFSLTVTSVCSVIGVVLGAPSIKMVVICLGEALLLIFSLGMVSVTFGIKGADFRELPRPRMITRKWALINGAVCILLALAIVSPLIPYALKLSLQAVQAPASISLPLPEAYLYTVLPISGIIACVVGYVFYRIALKNAGKFLVKAEG